MKKLFSAKAISFFVCLCFIAVLPLTAFAAKEKQEISLGDAYSKVYDGKEVSDSDVYALVSTKSGGVTVFTYKWFDAKGTELDYNPVNAGEYILEIKVSDKDPHYKGSATVGYIIEQRPLDWDVSSLKVTKPYDGTATAASVSGKITATGKVDGDDVNLVYDSIKAADFPTADVQRVTVPLTIINAKLEGKDAANYTLPKISPVIEAAITKASIIDISFPDNDNKYRIVVEETVYVTGDLSATEFNTVDGIKNALRAKIGETFTEDDVHTAFYTAVLQVLKDDQWVEVEASEWPQDEVKFCLGYPEGTSGGKNEFVVYKLATKGKDAGVIEVWAHSEKVDGLEIVLSQGDALGVGYIAKNTNTTMLIVIGAVAVMVIAGAVYLKLRKADKEEARDFDMQA
ncbi:MAG: hypothetical protein IIV99_05490 [Oscillospiraceae bacterium]|nr:hypothetical protein [Oscillospiraceae bacterium]